MNQFIQILNEQYHIYLVVACLCQILVISQYTFSLVLFKVNLANFVPISQEFNVIKYMEEISFKFKDYNFSGLKPMNPNNVDQVVFAANINSTNEDSTEIEWWTLEQLEALPRNVIDYLELYFSSFDHILEFLNMEVTSIVELPGLDLISINALTMLAIIEALKLNQDFISSQIFTIVLPYMEIITSMEYTLPSWDIIFNHVTSLTYGVEFLPRINSNINSAIYGYVFDLELLSNYIENSDSINAAQNEDQINVLMTGFMVHTEIIRYIVQPLVSSVIDILNHYMDIQANFNH